MRIPSLQQLSRSATSTLRRFPLVLAAALTAAVAAQVLVDESGSDLAWRILYVATLGLPLLFAAATLAERRGWTPRRRAFAGAAGLGLLAVVFLARPGWTDSVAGYRYLQLSAGFHLLVAFLPYVKTGTTTGFWQYNRTLFLRFLTAVLYSVVLFVGLSVAVLAVEELFGVGVPDETYVRLWIAIAFVFHPWFFLAGVPDDLEALDRRADYPKGLKIFVQYVLVPLVIVYLVILTAYAVRVLATWEWPSGWIGWLVSSVAVAGILAALLVHPVRDRAENRWVRVYGRWFWPALLPSIVLLFLAVWQRISQYGVTEERFFLMILAVWLAGVTVYYAVTVSDEIRVVPQTLCAVVLLTVAGPWSAYSVSLRSQVDRLQGHLREHGLLVDGELRRADGPVPIEGRKEISAGFRYLVGTHGSEVVRPWFDDGPAGPDRDADGGGSGDGAADGEPVSSARQAVSRLGLAYVGRGQAAGRGQYVHVRAGQGSGARSLAGYGWIVRGLGRGDADTLRVDGRRLVVRGDSAEVVVLQGSRTVARLSVERTVRRALREHGEGEIPPGGLWRAREIPSDALSPPGGSLRAALWLRSARGRDHADGRLVLTAWEADLLLGTGDAPDPGAAGAGGP